VVYDKDAAVLNLWKLWIHLPVLLGQVSLKSRKEWADKINPSKKCDG